MNAKDPHDKAGLGAALSASPGDFQVAAKSHDVVLANLDWVRALSQRLVHDAATADDLVQKAWLVAQGKEPRGGGGSGTRAWLSGVLRNLARDERRTEARRRRREVESVVESDTAALGTEAPDELVACSEQMTEVAQLVLEIDEPFRRVMLLRWFDGLTSAQVAKREGIPAATVRTRLHRGLGQLRVKLDARHGGDTQSWALALIPAAGFAPSGKAAAGVGSLKGLGWTTAGWLTAGAVGWVALAAVASDKESKLETAITDAQDRLVTGADGAPVAVPDAQPDEKKAELRDIVPGDFREARTSVPNQAGDDAIDASKGVADDRKSPRHLIEKDWMKAKEGMRAEFALSPNWDVDIDHLVFELTPLRHSKLATALSLKNPASIEWDAVLKLGEGEPLTNSQVEDLTHIAAEYGSTLKPMRADTRDLLERSLLEYWEHDLGQRYRVSVTDVEQLPPRQEPVGVFNSEFVAQHGDWAVYVAFDSATFPVLEDLLLEAKRLKEAFYSDLDSVLAY